jgi:hypothetical protein
VGIKMMYQKREETRKKTEKRMYREDKREEIGIMKMPTHPSLGSMPNAKH